MKATKKMKAIKDCKRIGIGVAAGCSWPGKRRNPQEVEKGLHPSGRWMEWKKLKRICVCNSKRLEIISQREPNLFDSIAEAFGSSGADPGHWNFSPEWYGTQGGGWGKDNGTVVFQEESEYNGLVEVTAHPATPIANSNSNEEWRVLRFNGLTRETAMRVSIQNLDERSGLKNGAVIADPTTLAQEYLKSIASLFAGFYGSLLENNSKTDNKYSTIELQSDVNECNGESQIQMDKEMDREPVRLLCIGIGGGSLPLFLAHHFPEIQIDAVEIDPVVVKASQTVLGMPSSSLPKNLNIITDDAYQYLRNCSVGVYEPGSLQEDGTSLKLAKNKEAIAGNKAQSIPENPSVSNAFTMYFDYKYDGIIMDAFNGTNSIPESLVSTEFALLLGNSLKHKQGSFFIANLHDVDVKSVAETFHKCISKAISRSCRPQLQKIENSGSNTEEVNGGFHHQDAQCSSFTIDVQRQSNSILGCCLQYSPYLENESSLSCVVDIDKLKSKAKQVAAMHNYKFLVASRVVHGFKTV